jgi:hypothetical protein
MEIIHLKLSDLPFETEAKLLSGLQHSFSAYGQVLDAGIIVEPTTETYSGTGYVTINIKSQDARTTYRDLTHAIHWDGSEKQSFLAVWSTMKPHCVYCRAEGHGHLDCPELKKRYACWLCGDTDHQKAQCLKPNLNSCLLYVPLISISSLFKKLTHISLISLYLMPNSDLNKLYGFHTVVYYPTLMVSIFLIISYILMIESYLPSYPSPWCL